MLPCTALRDGIVEASFVDFEMVSIPGEGTYFVCNPQ